MQTKYTDSTVNRPDGERIIDAPYVFVDMKKFKKQLKKEDAWKKNDRNSITICKTEEMTFVLTSLHKNAAIEDNSVNGLLTIQVLNGVLDFIVGNKTMTLQKNQMITLHPEIVHSLYAKEKTTILLIHNAPC